MLVLVLVLVLEKNWLPWGGFDFADRRQGGFLSRRDYGTQPGILTPEIPSKTRLPERPTDSCGSAATYG